MRSDDARLSPFMDVAVEVTAELGRCTLRLGEVLQLGAGSVIALEQAAGDPVDLMVNDERIGRGELIAIDDRYGVHVTEIHVGQQRPAASATQRETDSKGN